MSFVLDKLKLFRRNRMMCEIKMDEVSKIIELTQLEVFSQSIVELQQNKEYIFILEACEVVSTRFPEYPNA